MIWFDDKEQSCTFCVKTVFLIKSFDKILIHLCWIYLTVRSLQWTFQFSINNCILLWHGSWKMNMEGKTKQSKKVSAFYIAFKVWIVAVWLDLELGAIDLWKWSHCIIHSQFDHHPHMVQQNVENFGSWFEWVGESIAFLFFGKYLHSDNFIQCVTPRPVKFDGNMLGSWHDFGQKYVLHYCSWKQ